MSKKLTLKSMNYKIKNVKCCNNCYFGREKVSYGCTDFGCDIADRVILDAQRLGVCDYWLDEKFEPKHICKEGSGNLDYYSDTQTFDCDDCDFSKKLEDVIKRRKIK